LAWQAYGDAARRLIAPAASTSDQQQLNAMPLDLDAVRRSIDGLAISIGASIATSQEQTTRSIDQLTAASVGQFRCLVFIAHRVSKRCRADDDGHRCCEAGR
jgi:hypothetical protein